MEELLGPFCIDYVELDDQKTIWSAVKVFGMKGQMVSNEGRNKVVTMIVTRMPAQFQIAFMLLCCGLQMMWVELFF